MSRPALYLLYLLFAPVCLGQTITVRIIDVETGNPLPSQRVSISLMYEKGDKTPANYISPVILITDDKGSAQISIPSPAPRYVNFLVALSSEWWQSERDQRFTLKTKELMQKGAVGRMVSEGRNETALTAKPREVLILTRPLVYP